MFSRVLVANRGEIAVRVFATLRRMGIVGIAVASAVDRRAPHTSVADITVHLEDGPQAGGTDTGEPYLSVERIIDAARRTGAQAIHPGYGFLSESARLAEACTEAGITFIGPPASAIATMGDKITAKTTVSQAGVPVVPGVSRSGMSDDELLEAAPDVGYPLLVKAAAGGGGKGMRAVQRPGDLAEALAAARRESRGAFGDDELLMERLIAAPRHIEIQVVADTHGTVWGLTERECTLQRRHQKVIEESPSAVLHPDVRERMQQAATEAARACGYTGAGTVEFIMPGAQVAGPDAEFFFLEMNTRLQVEHPVTELIHNLDLVEWQVRIAAGAALPGDPPAAVGHAVEARVYAEDPTRAFLPTGGTVLAYREPSLPGLRIDSGVAAGSEVGAMYDPMLAKVIAYAGDRQTAIQRLQAGLRGFVTLGVSTNNAFLQALLHHEVVRQASFDTEFIEHRLDELVEAATDAWSDQVVPVVAAMVWLLGPNEDTTAHDPRASVDRVGPGRRGGHGVSTRAGWRLGVPATSVLAQMIGQHHHRVVIAGDAENANVLVDDRPDVTASALWCSDGRLAVTVDGIQTAWDVAHGAAGLTIGREGRMWTVVEGSAVEAAQNDGLAVAGPVTAPMPGTVTLVDVTTGEQVTVGQRLMVVEAMKMEHPIVASLAGVVESIDVAVGDRVGMDDRLAVVALGDADEMTDA